MPVINKAAAAAIAEQNESPTSAVKAPSITSKIDNTSPVIEFLEGKNCLTGVRIHLQAYSILAEPLEIWVRSKYLIQHSQGTGWWKYEFCYGRYVRQFHIDKNGETSVMLGYFDEDAHKQWLQENPQKRPAKSTGARHLLRHFYQGGSLCDKTGEKRQTEVQLKCMENSSSLTKVSLFLMEPNVCQYILGVESPLICEIIEKADEDGLVSREDLSHIVEQKTSISERSANERDDAVADSHNNESNGNWVKVAFVDFYLLLCYRRLCSRPHWRRFK